MREPDVLHVRAVSEGRFSLEGSGVGGRTVSGAEMAEAVRALPESSEIRLTNDGGTRASLIAAVNAALQRRRAESGARRSDEAARASRARRFMRLSQRRDGLYDVEVEPVAGCPGFEVAGLSAAAVVERYLGVGRYKFTCRDARGRLAIEQPPDDIARALEASGRGYGRETRCERCGDTGDASHGPCPWCSVAIPSGRGPAAPASRRTGERALETAGPG